MSEYNVIKFYKMYESVEVPKLQTKYSACFDIPAFLDKREQVLSYNNINSQEIKLLRKSPSDGYQRNENKNKDFILILPFERVLIPTGLIFSFDCMYSLRIHARSGLSIKNGLVLANQEGIIDCDYNQQLFICLINLTNVEQRIYNGDRIAQGEIVPNMHEMDSMKFSQIFEKPKQLGNRTGGFGSTGV